MKDHMITTLASIVGIGVLLAGIATGTASGGSASSSATSRSVTREQR